MVHGVPADDASRDAPLTKCRAISEGSHYVCQKPVGHGGDHASRGYAWDDDDPLYAALDGERRGAARPEAIAERQSPASDHKASPADDHRDPISGAPIPRIDIKWPDGLHDLRCPDCGQMMTSHVIRTRHASGTCDEAFHGPELRATQMPSVAPAKHSRETIEACRKVIIETGDVPVVRLRAICERLESLMVERDESAPSSSPAESPHEADLANLLLAARELIDALNHVSFKMTSSTGYRRFRRAECALSEMLDELPSTPFTSPAKEKP